MGGGGRVGGRDFFSLALCLLSFFFFFSPPLSNKMSRGEGGERPSSGDAAARLKRAPQAAAAGRWVGLPAGHVFVRGPGRGTQRAGPRGRIGRSPVVLLLPGS